jgi:hypothetical protein
MQYIFYWTEACMGCSDASVGQMGRSSAEIPSDTQYRGMESSKSPLQPNNFEFFANGNFCSTIHSIFSMQDYYIEHTIQS